MLLFVMVVDYSTLFVVLLVIIILSLVIYFLSRRILRRIMKNATDRKVNLLSQLIAFLLVPVLVIGTLAYLISIFIPIPGKSEVIANHYTAIETELSGILKIGMSKKEVVAQLGDSDTTQAVVIYDLSSPGAKEKYILELQFDENGLIGFERLKADSVK
jgi:hypothetical protein